MNEPPVESSPPASEIPFPGDADGSAVRQWSNRSLNALAVLSIALMLASFVQVFKQYYAQQRPSEATVARQPLFDKPKATHKQKGLDELIPDHRLREEVLQIEHRLREARKEKALALSDAEHSRKTDPNRSYADRRQVIEDALETIGLDQPGLTAPLLEQLDKVEQDAPMRK